MAGIGRRAVIADSGGAGHNGVRLTPSTVETQRHIIATLVIVLLVRCAMADGAGLSGTAGRE